MRTVKSPVKMLSNQLFLQGRQNMAMKRLLAALAVAGAMLSQGALAQRFTDTEIVLGSHLDLSGPTAAGDRKSVV